MKMFSKLVFLTAMTLSFSSFGKVRIKLVDKDNKAIAGAPVMAVVSGTRVTTNGRGGLPIPGVHRYNFGGANYLTDSNGVISSEPQRDLNDISPGLFGKRKSISFAEGVYAEGPSFQSANGSDNATCVAVTGKDRLDDEQLESLRFGSVSIHWNDSDDLDVVCKFKDYTAQEVLAQAKEILKTADDNGATVRWIKP